ncbi:hypothetical protein [Nocardioides aestuarii]|uniref:Uncharacterized protein n=1 Tax=Nocardioides aestuarii TaxID=252231 RepID=A0ABW4TKQ2_9ACTN
MVDDSRPGAALRERVAACRQMVDAARLNLDRARATRPDLDLRGFRADLLWALEEYESAITEVGAPLPPRLRREIQLYRQLADRR